MQMCFYDQKRFACGDWAWGRFATQCTHEYRMGETCGMKLVNETEYIHADCKLCEKIKTKIRRMNAETERVNRWRREGSKVPATIEKSQETIKHLEGEIQKLQSDRMTKQRAIGK